MNEFHLLPIIGLTGYAGSGKDLVAAMLGMIGYQRRAFADLLKREVEEAILAVQSGRMNLCELPVEYGVDTIDAISRRILLPGDVRKKPTHPLMRLLLQRHGTEYRRMKDETYWIQQVMADRPALLVISDVRFVNEARAIRDAGGVLWRVSRPGVDAANEHVSEQELRDIECDYYVSNESTLWELQEQVKEALRR